MDCQPKWRILVDSARRLLWPPVCVLCGGRGREPAMDLCLGCETDLARLGAACPRCAQPFAPGAPALTCGRCLQRPPHFQRTYCAYLYVEPLASLIRAFKYRGDTAAGRVLGMLLSERLRERAGPLPDAIVPVPLGRQRFRTRGFNQAIELGVVIEKRLGIRMRADLVERVRDTAEQAGLGPRQRRRNVRRAFRMLKRIPGKHLVVLDDVMTTGSTVNEVARVLRAAGAEIVEVWAVARAGVKDAASAAAIEIVERDAHEDAHSKIVAV